MPRFLYNSFMAAMVAVAAILVFAADTPLAADRTISSTEGTRPTTVDIEPCVETNVTLGGNRPKLRVGRPRHGKPCRGRRESVSIDLDVLIRNFNLVGDSLD